MPFVPGAFIVPLIVACALFIENVDATVLLTALPSLARDLGEDPITLKLAVTSYVVGLGVFIPICGWVADRFGPRSVFRAAIGVFVAGSLLCAAANTLFTLVLARFVQGIGGAMMVPVGRIIIFRSVRRADFVHAVNYLTVPALLGPVVGPLLGGFITTYLDWRLMFFINVPIGLLGIYLANRHIDDVRETEAGHLDWPGFVLSAAGASLFRIGLGAVPFALPLALQEGLGMTLFEAATITCASACGALCMRAATVAFRARTSEHSVDRPLARFPGTRPVFHGVHSHHRPHAEGGDGRACTRPLTLRSSIPSPDIAP